MYEVQIMGTGSFVPEQIIKNDCLSNFVDTNDEWISSRTGIKEEEYHREKTHQISHWSS